MFPTFTLQSKIDVIEKLKALFVNYRPGGNDDTLHREWNHVKNLLLPFLRGVDGWDYSTMDWPTDIPLFNITTNSVAAASAIEIEQVGRGLQSLHLPWVVRIESYDRLCEGVMIGGEELRDLILTKDAIYLWEARPGAITDELRDMA
jgi:hypothetical protein